MDPACAQGRTGGFVCWTFSQYLSGTGSSWRAPGEADSQTTGMAPRGSPEWTGTAPTTKIDYNKALIPLETEFGHLSVPEMPRKFVFWLRDRYATKSGKNEGGQPVPTPRRANRKIAVLSILLTWAVNREWRPYNPALRVPKLKTLERFLSDLNHFGIPLSGAI